MSWIGELTESIISYYWWNQNQKVINKLYNVKISNERNSLEYLTRTNLGTRVSRWHLEKVDTKPYPYPRSYFQLILAENMKIIFCLMEYQAHFRSDSMTTSNCPTWQKHGNVCCWGFFCAYVHLFYFVLVFLALLLFGFCLFHSWRDL